MIFFVNIYIMLSIFFFLLCNKCIYDSININFNLCILELHVSRKIICDPMRFNGDIILTTD